MLEACLGFRSADGRLLALDVANQLEQVGAAVLRVARDGRHGGDGVQCVGGQPDRECLRVALQGPLEVVAVELVLHADVGEKACAVVGLACARGHEDVPDVSVQGIGRVCIAALGVNERRAVNERCPFNGVQCPDL